MVNINFQPDTSPVPSGYIEDNGDAYSSSRGFGWVREDSLSTTTHTPIDIRTNSRDRNRSGIDQKLDTLLHMQYSYASNTTAEKTPAAWEYDLANGTYNVTVSAGDKGKYDSLNTINVEGVNAINSFQGSSTQEYQQATVQVNVNDGKLTVDAVGGTNTKINYINIASVASAASGPEIDLQNLDVVPSNDRMVFSRIGSLTNPPANNVHDVGTLRIKNTGTGSTPLQISSLAISGTWKLTKSFTPTNIAAGSYLDVSVQFTATSGDVHTGSLTIKSNDSDESTKVVQLAGFWQSVSEGGQEPSVKEIAQVFGYTPNFTFGSQKLNRGGLVQTVGDEVFSPYWQRANTSQSVSVRQLASYHTYGNTVKLAWYSKGSSTTNTVFTAAGADAQSLLPLKSGSTQSAAGTFTPSSTFGFKVDNEWSNPTLNDQSQDADDSDGDGYISPGPDGHHVRFWQLRDQGGNLVSNTWLMIMDYNGINYDYNDNVYLVSNIRPESRTALYRIDVGSSSSYKDSNGNVWSSDAGFFSSPTGIAPAENGGNANPKPSINYTTSDTIYQTYRGNVGGATPQSNRILNFNFNVAAGTKVELRLEFAELYWGASGRGPADTGDKRVFDVIAEGTTVMDNYNISTAAGGALSATRAFVRNITVGNDGVLNLSFKAETDFASIAGIQVLTA